MIPVTVSFVQQTVLVGLGPLVVLLFLGVIVFFATSKNGGRAAAMFLGACFLAFLIMASLWVGYARVKATNEQARVAELKADARATEEIWEEMNRPRIRLSEEALAEPAASEGLVKTYVKVLEDYAVAKAKAATTASTDTQPDSIDTVGGADGQLFDGDDAEDSKPVKRPDWVDMLPKRVGNVYREVVVSQRFTRVTECHKDLDSRLREVVRQRMEQLVGRSYVPDIHSLGLSLDYVWSNICREEWIETVDSSVGEMKRVHVLMEFDAAVDKRLERAYRDYRRGHRIEEVGAVVAVVLAILVGIYALLKIDTLTRGYYTKRLFFGVPAAIIFVIIVIVIADS